MTARTVRPGLVPVAPSGRPCPWCGAPNASGEHIAHCGGRLAPEPVGFWLDGVWITDCPYCGAPMGTEECCGLSTDEAYAAAVVGSAGGDIFLGPAGATLVEPERARRLPHALKGGAR